MRKRLMSVFAVMMCITICLTLCSCGSKGTGSNANSTKMAEFIDSMGDQLDSFRASLGDSMEMDVVARGNSLVYVYKYKSDLGADNDTVAAALDSALDSMESTFTGILSSLRTQIPEAESVIVEYLDKDGNLILSREFK